jgi:hypothetical protein
MTNNTWFLRATLIELCAWSSLSFAFAACAHSGLNTPPGTNASFDLVVRSTVDNTNNHPANITFSVSASCQKGQQMVGGGYRLINNSNAHPTLVVVNGNFPASATTWTVQVTNPDNPSVYSGDSDVAVMALAYCMTTPNFDLDTEIVSQKVTIPHTLGGITDIDVRCSQSSALALSGGFMTTSLPAFVETGGAVHQTFWPGLQGTGITGSGPRLPDSTHSSMGWHLTQQYTPAFAPTAPQPDVTTSVFALCARQNINDQSRRVVLNTRSITPAAPAETLCQSGEFTVGGGYDRIMAKFGQGGVAEIDGSSAMHSPFAFTGWQISGDSVNAPIDATALCVSIPTK